ncbi:MAG: chromosome segregation protein SMC [Acidobacteria bacterium]|nr:MAG: chromosome segregation protein SMC [Acidobacteriota bacterium]REK03981.1 MAG: chromosome segregation protein SMC [Acidobacteriota bacterium]REK15143.1 MAG: chromosome segregation protein SMC [Acidobacteriota bacterium]REK46233.1 MAG: chromosome segregation protein SMC [Acidobacteriota bacterium]
MFKLQRLEITGFKSFADYTEIVFTGKGITAVVGPNGCGKSNVSDAISWVLGEQRPTSLRGQEMKDVVFQGTSKRDPGGMAEVVLHLERDETEYVSDETELEDIDEKLGEIDEHSVDMSEVEPEEDDPEDLVEVVAEAVEGEDEEESEEVVKAAQVGSAQTIQKRVRTKRRWRPRNFALEFAPGEAVSVTRRLYLSGESEYLLNNKNCRLRDIQDLFAGTGLSGAHYAIIEQGRIGQILSSKPSNRRTLIEEAAGISKFRMRQRAAESRLAAAKQNLGRITDIVAEIEKQTRSLRRQASKTRRYKVLKEEFRGLLKKTYASEGASFQSRLAELEGLVANAIERERECFEAVTAKDEEFRKATLEARDAEDRVTEVRAKHAENALRRDRTKREHEYQVTRMEELAERATNLAADLRATESRVGDLLTELGKLDKEVAAEQEAADKQRDRLREAENVYAGKLKKLNEFEKELEEVRSEHLQHNAAVERLEEIGRQFEGSIERLRQRTDGLEREHERARKTHEERRNEFEKLGSDLEAEKAKLSELNEERSGILQKLDKAKEELSAKTDVQTRLTERYSRVHHRLETLEELEEKKAIYSPSVQKVFGEQKNIGVRFIGTLADKLRVDKNAERAVENLFGQGLQSILVSSKKDARKTIEYLNRNELGRIAVLVVDKEASPGELNGNLNGTVGGVLGAEDDLLTALLRAFPREMHARLIDSLRDADEADHEIAATWDGDIVAGGQLYVSGRTPEGEKNVSILGFKRELSELKLGASELAAGIKRAEEDVETASATVASLEDRLVDLQALIVKIERESLSKEVHARSLAQEIERAERHRTVVSDEISQNVSEIESLESRKREAAENAGIASKALVLTEEKMGRIGESIGGARSDVDDENVVLNRRRTDAEVAAERLRSAKTALERVNLERSELESRAIRQKEEIEETRLMSEALKKSSVDLAKQIEAAAGDEEGERDELNEAITHLSAARESSDNKSTELAEINKVAAAARDDRASLEIRKTETVSSLKNLDEKIAEDLGTSLEQLVESVEIEEGFELAKAREEVRRLRSRLDNFGAINMLALDELSETEERLEFLTAQKSDVEESIKAAEEALREIKRRSRQRFKDAFEAINKNFTDFFSELFGGGTGEMVLLEADDVLEAGVEIIAQPPGKRLQNMLLLSGGEKAMTAIALVLAIFKYRPSPFCLLDEVDAPLDDANVGRFVNRIESMSENTQFIVITHNKRTMEAAKALYGVTMQEAGVSKIVSVRFD